jgi:hypothetical protein
MGSRQLRETITAVTVMLRAMVVAWVATPASTQLGSGPLLAAHEDVAVLTGDVDAGGP